MISRRTSGVSCIITTLLVLLALAFDRTTAHVVVASHRHPRMESIPVQPSQQQQAARTPSTTVSTIISGTTWRDTSGNSIQAHGAGILIDPLSSYYYWFGESEKTSDLTQHGVNCYRSTDLLNWEFVRSSINQSSIVIPDVSGPFTIERPKVLYNQQTEKYVMWFHADNNDYSIRRVGVAVAANPFDEFEFVSAFQPDDLPSLDMSVYEDRRNGTVQGAYFVRSVDNSYVGISKLTSDYLGSAGLVSVIPEAREGHAIFHYGTAYYMITSHLTGWSPNAAELFMSNKDTLIGAEWTSLGNPTGSSTTFDSQSAFVLPFPSTTNPGEDFYIYMGDRWDYPNLLNASYIWLPIKITSDKSMSIDWHTEWSLSDY